VEPTRATLIEAVVDGWWYASLLADGRLALNYFTDPDLLPRGVTRDLAVFRGLLDQTQYISRWLEEADFRVDAAPRLDSAGTTWVALAAGEGWAAVGDASAAFDPLSSFGMTTALWTAITVAESVAAGDLGSYPGKVAVGVQDFLVTREKVYAMEQRYADHAFWKCRRLEG